MIYIGIDPGKSGAMAAINSETGRVLVRPFDPAEYNISLGEFALNGKKCFAVVERVSAMPGQGVVGVFNFGQNFGYIQGLLEAHGIPYELVRPQAWKRAFGCTKDKNTSLAVCRRLFPDVCLKRTANCKKDDDGIAEALLMAEYGRRTYEK